MTLSQDGYEFESVLHDTLRSEGGVDAPIVPGTFFGARGESHITGPAQGRDLFCEVTLFGYDDYDELRAAIDALDQRQNELTGDLVETIGGDAVTWPACTFRGFHPTGRAFFSPTHSWIQHGTLHWRQRRIV